MTDEWRERANCRDMHPSMFYPNFNNLLITPETVKACNECPVQSECLDYALRHEDYGFWGGTTEKDRRLLRKRLGIDLEVTDTNLRFIQPHGTAGGYARHLRAGEKPCEGCRQAKARQSQAWKQQNRRTQNA